MKKGILKKICVFCLTAALISVSAFFADVCAAVDREWAIEGSDGWIFSDYAGGISSYQGTDLYTSSQLESIKNGFEALQQEFSEQGTEFIILIAPNKERIYSAYMPEEYGSLAAYSRIDQLLDTLGGDIRVVCPLSALENAASEYPQYDFYYRTDIHWNSLGAYVGARELLKELGVNLPGLNDVDVNTNKINAYTTTPITEDDDTGEYDDEFTIWYDGVYWGDMVNLTDDRENYRYLTSRAPHRKMMVIGDSFSMAMMPYLGQAFDEITTLHIKNNAARVMDEIRKEQPSVVVFEVSERFFDRVPAFTDELMIQ